MKIAKESKYNPKAFYKYAHSKLKMRRKIGNQKDEEGRIITDPSDKANLMNAFFSSVFIQEEITNMPAFEPRPYITPLEYINITADKVEKKLEKLNPSKSLGSDKMHPRVLREMHQVLAEPLAKLFQLSIETESLPIDWKVGNVSPIHKKGSRQTPGNYRPVSLTSVVGKVLEQLIRDVVTDHLVSNNLLTSCQHGFIKGRSCITQLLATLDHWTDVMDRGDIDAVYLDFSKCFDSVPHERLLLKLRQYGIQGKLWCWISDFLKGRKQQVSIEGCLSILTMVLSGIPQGSVLGPLLFIIFVNEMPDLVHSGILMFADDTKLFTEIHNEEDVKRLQTDLTALQDGSQIWQLKFNPDKCHVLHLGRNNQKYKYNMRKKSRRTDNINRNSSAKGPRCANQPDSIIQFSL